MYLNSIKELSGKNCIACIMYEYSAFQKELHKIQILVLIILNTDYF